MDVLPRSSPNVIEYDVNPPPQPFGKKLTQCMYVCFEEPNRKYQIKNEWGFVTVPAQV